MKARIFRGYFLDLHHEFFNDSIEKSQKGALNERPKTDQRRSHVYVVGCSESDTVFLVFGFFCSCGNICGEAAAEITDWEGSLHDLYRIVAAAFALCSNQSEDRHPHPLVATFYCLEGLLPI
jgi:hypothetical protein